MLEKLKQILEQANPSYKIIYEEKHMMNVKVDELEKEDSFVYIEEFIRGRYTLQGFTKRRIMTVQLYFSKSVEMHDDATVRQALRNQIESEIVLPFMEQWNLSTYFDKVDDWNVYYPLPRWDANEVSVMLEFEVNNMLC